jgi:hypothetical protein
MLAVITSHAAVTPGTNWTAISVIVGSGITLGGGALKWLTGRLGIQDAKIDDVGKVTADTRVSVARIEGYFAARNGSGGATPTQLPDLPAPVIVPANLPVRVEK